MKKILKKEPKGITLIALVVTIVVLLILAGVTITMVLGEDGIIKQAQKAGELTLIANEKEYLQQNLLSVQLGDMLDNVTSEKLGETLYDKNLHGKWHVLTSNNTTYGTGWNYIEKGTILEGFGNAKYNWVINYETGEIVQLEEKQYNSVTIDDTMAVKDDFIINIDSAMFDKGVENSKEQIENELGEGVELHNFDFKNDGLINNEFVFDGKNDFILIDYDKVNVDGEKLLENGFTFEFYGKIEKGKQLLYKEDVFGQEVINTGYSAGIFQITEENDTYYFQDQFSRVIAFFTSFEGKLKKNFALYFGGGAGDDEFDRIESSGRKNWIKEYKIENENDEYSYYTVSIMKNNDGKFTQSFFENGKLIKTGELNEKCINNLSNLKKRFLTIGVAEEGYADESGNSIGKACLSKINAKCLRLYNRGLTNEEVLQNYEKTTSYHDLMKN